MKKRIYRKQKTLSSISVKICTLLITVDTHALVWHLTEDDHLGTQARKLLNKADMGNENMVVPTIVLAEAYYISEKYNKSFEGLLDKINSSPNYSSYPLNLKIIELIKDLPEVYSIHDAIIVATANILETELISKDETIEEQSDVATLWN